MSTYRETPCIYYIAFSKCQKGRDASHKAYCQRCRLYEPRAKVKQRNKKKDMMRRISKVIAVE